MKKLLTAAIALSFARNVVSFAALAENERIEIGHWKIDLIIGNRSKIPNSDLEFLCSSILGARMKSKTAYFRL